MTVLEATIQTLKNLGGKAHYSKIYEEYENVIGYKITKNQQAGIRKCIETHSSDSDVFNGKDDIFYSVYGKGNGVWGFCPVLGRSFFYETILITGRHGL